MIHEVQNTKSVLFLGSLSKQVFIRLIHRSRSGAASTRGFRLGLGLVPLLNGGLAPRLAPGLAAGLAPRPAPGMAPAPGSAPGPATGPRAATRARMRTRTTEK